MTKDIKDVLDSDYEEVTIAKDLAPNSVTTKITWQKAMPTEYDIYENKRYNIYCFCNETNNR